MTQDTRPSRADPSPGADAGYEEMPEDRAMGSRSQDGRNVAPTNGNGIGDAAGDPPPLLSAGDAQTLRERWTGVQGQFVDEPKHAVELADGLVSELIEELSSAFASERSNLERQWGRGEEVSTEDLRNALRMYRSFFDRLLAV